MGDTGLRSADADRVGPTRSRSRRPRLRTALVAVVVAVAVAPGCGHDERRVLVIGDSLTWEAGQVGLGDDEGDGWVVDAVIGRTTMDGVGMVHRRPIDRFDLVIVALGTNDHEDTRAEFARKIDAMMAAIGDREVVWVNLDLGAPGLARATGVNRAIAEATDRFPNLRVADWNAYVADHPEMEEYRRGVHYTRPGSEERARWTESLARE